MGTKAADSKHLVLNRNAIDVEIARTEGFYVHSTSGKKYLDFTSGWCVGNLGWGNSDIRKTIHRYKGPDYVAPAFYYEPWAELAELLCTISPGKLDKVYRCTGGTEAVEVALQIAMVYTGRKKFLSLEDSYHGNSIAALSIGATSAKQDMPMLLPGCIKIKAPLNAARLVQLETTLRKKNVAAFIIEPVPMNLGVEIPDAEFMDGARKLCRKYGTLFIADEVASGFGRTGKLFACEHYKLAPDILCLAKGLSGGYGPIGATLTTNAIFKKVREKLHIYSTYGWHPLSVASSLANLRHMLENKNQLLQKVELSSQRFRTALSQMSFRKGGRISMIGLAIGVELEEESYAAQVKEKCLKKGLLVTQQGSKLVMFPPLTVTRIAIDAGMSILRDSL